MKKFLSLLGAITLTASATSGVVACGVTADSQIQPPDGDSSRIKSLEKQVADQKKQISDLESERDSLEKQRNDLTKNLAEAKQEQDILVKTVDDLTADNKAKDKKITELEGTKAVLESKLSDLQSKYDSLSKELEDAKKELLGVEQQRDLLEWKCAQLDQERQRLQGELDKEREANERNKTEIKVLEGTIQNLINNSDKNDQAAQEKISQLEQQKEALIQAGNESLRKISGLEQQIKKLDKQIDGYKAQIESLKNELTDLTNKYNSALNELKIAYIDILNLKNQIQDLNSTIEDARKVIKYQIGRIEDLNNQISTLNKNINKLNSDLIRVQREWEKAAEAYELSQEALNKAVAEISKLQGELEKAIKDKENSSVSIADMNIYTSQSKSPIIMANFLNTPLVWTEIINHNMEINNEMPQEAGIININNETGQITGLKAGDAWVQFKAEHIRPVTFKITVTNPNDPNPSTGGDGGLTPVNPDPKHPDKPLNPADQNYNLTVYQNTTKTITWAQGINLTNEMITTTPDNVVDWIVNGNVLKITGKTVANTKMVIDIPNYPQITINITVLGQSPITPPDNGGTGGDNGNGGITPVDPNDLSKGYKLELFEKETRKINLGTTLTKPEAKFSSEGVASQSIAGEILTIAGLKPGNTILTITTEKNGTLTIQITVDKLNNVTPTDPDLKPGENGQYNLSMYTGDVKDITLPKINIPTNADLTSSNETVATVKRKSNNVITISALTAGQSTITLANIQGYENFVINLTVDQTKTAKPGDGSGLVPDPSDKTGNTYKTTVYMGEPRIITFNGVDDLTNAAVDVVTNPDIVTASHNSNSLLPNQLELTGKQPSKNEAKVTVKIPGYNLITIFVTVKDKTNITPPTDGGDNGNNGGIVPTPGKDHEYDLKMFVNETRNINMGVDITNADIKQVTEEGQKQLVSFEKDSNNLKITSNTNTGVATLIVSMEGYNTTKIHVSVQPNKDFPPVTPGEGNGNLKPIDPSNPYLMSMEMFVNDTKNIDLGVQLSDKDITIDNALLTTKANGTNLEVKSGATSGPSQIKVKVEGYNEITINVTIKPNGNTGNLPDPSDNNGLTPNGENKFTLQMFTNEDKPFDLGANLIGAEIAYQPTINGVVTTGTQKGLEIKTGANTGKTTITITKYGFNTITIDLTISKRQPITPPNQGGGNNGFEPSDPKNPDNGVWNLIIGINQTVSINVGIDLTDPKALVKPVNDDNDEYFSFVKDPTNRQNLSVTGKQPNENKGSQIIISVPGHNDLTINVTVQNRNFTPPNTGNGVEPTDDPNVYKVNMYVNDIKFVDFPSSTIKNGKIDFDNNLFADVSWVSTVNSLSIKSNQIATQTRIIITQPGYNPLTLVVNIQDNNSFDIPADSGLTTDSNGAFHLGVHIGETKFIKLNADLVGDNAVVSSSDQNINATINHNGSVAVTGKKANKDSVLTVYDQKQHKEIKVHVEVYANVTPDPITGDGDGYLNGPDENGQYSLVLYTTDNRTINWPSADTSNAKDKFSPDNGVIEFTPGAHSFTLSVANSIPSGNEMKTQLTVTNVIGYNPLIINITVKYAKQPLLQGSTLVPVDGNNPNNASYNLNTGVGTKNIISINADGQPISLVGRGVEIYGDNIISINTEEYVLVDSSSKANIEYEVGPNLKDGLTNNQISITILDSSLNGKTFRLYIAGFYLCSVTINLN